MKIGFNRVKLPDIELGCASLDVVKAEGNPQHKLQAIKDHVRLYKRAKVTIGFTVWGFKGRKALLPLCYNIIPSETVSLC